MNQLINKEAIDSLQMALFDTPLTTDMREFTDHFFAPGVYLRTLFIPAGYVLVGAEHKHETLNILLKGTLSVVNDFGERLVCKAPFIFTAKPGRKAGYAQTDVWYANIFPNTDNVMDIPQLEQLHTEVSS